MSDNDLLFWYQKELSWLKSQGETYAVQHPKIARRLGMLEGGTEDPHVQRIIESFALLSARIQQRFDQDLPLVTEALLNSLAPHLLRRFPSATIVQFAPDRADGALSASHPIPSGTVLETHDIEGIHCPFRTVYPVDLHPLTLDAAMMQSDDNHQWFLQLHFQVWPGALFNARQLRIYLHGTNVQVNTLYALLCSGVKYGVFQHNGAEIRMTADQISGVGFGRDESLLNEQTEMTAAHTLLFDYSHFPQKFHFIDITLPEGMKVNSGETFSLEFSFERSWLSRGLEKSAPLVDKSLFRLFCAPIVNLFSQRAEPIVPHDHIAEYTIMPDISQRQHIAVWSVKEVSRVQITKDESVSEVLPPLFGIGSGGPLSGQHIFWQIVEDQDACRLTLVHRSAGALDPRVDRINVQLICSNGDLPAQLKPGHPDGDFSASLPVAGITCRALARPGPCQPAAATKQDIWQLISQLSLNHQLISGERGLSVLKSTLSLWLTLGNHAPSKLIALITSVAVSPVVSRLVSHDPHSMARGLEIHLVFRTEAASEPEYTLFCSLVERFLAQYAPVNSFSRVVTSIEQEEGSLQRWPVRAGHLVWM